MIATLSMTVFADVIIAEKDRVTVSDVIEDEADEEVISQDRIYEKDKVKVISDVEYDKLTLGDIQLDGVRAANIDDKVTLSDLEHKSYSFNMSSNTQKDHDSFAIKMSEMKCGDGLDYALIIKEDGKSVYKTSLNRATTLTVKANRNSSYEVIINNLSTSSLKYRVRINSYKR